MASVLTQIALLDIVFSLDSVITAVGMAKEVAIMIAAIVISVGIMMWASGPLGDFVERHPTIKMLALSFLLLIGMALVAEGFHQHIPKGYIYFAMGFSVFVEMLNLRARHAARPPQNIACLVTVRKKRTLRDAVGIRTRCTGPVFDLHVRGGLATASSTPLFLPARPTMTT